MEAQAAPDHTEAVAQCFHATVAACLASAQKQLVEDVQRLAVTLSEAVTNQFENTSRELQLEGFQTLKVNSALHRDSFDVPPIAAEARSMTSCLNQMLPMPCSAEQPASEEPPKSMALLLKPCSRKGRKTFKSAVRATMFINTLKRQTSSDKDEEGGNKCVEDAKPLSTLSTACPSLDLPSQSCSPEKTLEASEVHKDEAYLRSPVKDTADREPEENKSCADVGKKVEILEADLSGEAEPLSPKHSSVQSIHTSASSLVVHPAWVQAAASSKRSQLIRRRLTESSALFRQVSDLPMGRFRGNPYYYILKPGHPFCISWDMLTAIAMLHDVILIPLMAFDLPEDVTLDVLSVFTTVVWAVDLILSFFRGVADRQEGIIEMRPRRIACIYLKSWFTLDFTVVVVDILLLCMASSTSWVGIILLVRMLRILRLMRIVKIAKISERLADRLTIFEGRFSEMLAFSEKKTAGLSILKLLAVLVVINHFVACGWYGIGSLEGGGDKHWVLKHLDDADFSYRYGTAFHWAVTQFTPASMEVFPTNTVERTYNIFVIFGGLLMFSSVISSMTQSQLYIQKISAAQKQQRQAVQRYIAANSVSLELSSSILLFLKRRQGGAKKELNEQDVDALKLLPKHMIMSLRVEVFTPTLVAHGIFAFLKEMDMHAMSMICHNAVSEQSVLQSEDVFHVNTQSTHMYFVTSGRLAYFLGYEALPEDFVERGRWISEPCLWVEWEHCGRLSGESRCARLLQVGSQEFVRFASQSEVSQNLQWYARIFAAEAVREAGGAELVTDLWGGPGKVRWLIERVASKTYERIMLTWVYTDTLKQAFRSWKHYTGMAYIRSRQKRKICCASLWRPQQKVSPLLSAFNDCSPPSSPSSDNTEGFHGFAASLDDGSLAFKEPPPDKVDPPDLV